MKRKKRSSQNKSARDVHGQKARLDILDEPQFRLLLLMVSVFAAYGLCLGLRLLELPAWNGEEFRALGQRMLATHDAYYYMAAAQGSSFQTGYPEFVVLTRFLRDATGLALTTFAFWLPVILAPLAVLPVAVLAWREGLEEAVLPAALVTAGSGAFLLRTRLGFYDQDMLNLFLPLCYGAGLMLLLFGHAAKDWCFWRSGNTPATTWPHDRRVFFPGCLLTGLLAWAYLVFYPQGLFLVLALWGVALILGLVFAATPSVRVMLCFGLATVLLAAFKPLPGIVVAVVLAGAYFRFEALLLRPYVLWPLLILVLGGAVLVFEPGATWTWLVQKISHQARSDVLSSLGNLRLPTFLQSVDEAQPLEWKRLGAFLAGSTWIVVTGLAGYVYLVWKRPLYLLFLPFLGAGLSSTILGWRFAMYGGIVVALGLGFGGALLLRGLGAGKTLRAVLLALLAVGLLWPLGNQARALRPDPVVAPEHAAALLELQRVAPPDARIWTWWDHGFAAQYYSRRAAFSDGHRQRPTLLHPLGLVLMTDSTLQAAQIMKMATANQAAFVAPVDEHAHVQSLWAPYLRNPLAELARMAPEQAQETMAELAVTPLDWPDNLREQFLLVSWKDIPAAYWITYYGTWNFATETGLYPEAVLSFTADAPVDLTIGRLTLEENTYFLEEWVEVGRYHRSSRAWPNRNGLYAVLNRDRNEGYLLDERVFRSRMIQMLIADPVEFESYFELIINKFPTLRIYRLK